MAPLTHRTSATAVSSKHSDDVMPNNPLQSDFAADDNASMDSDERYLVRLWRACQPVDTMVLK